MTMNRRYTAQEREFLADFVPGHSYKEIAEAFNARFEHITVYQAKSYINNNHLNTNRDGRFRPGGVPSNKGKRWDEYMSPEAQEASRKTQFKAGLRRTRRPIGAETWRADGYLWRKVADTDPASLGWRMTHHLIWEEAHGAVPKGHCIAFKDGDHTHLALDNLMLITRAEHGVINRLGVAGAGETSKAIADVHMGMAKAARRIGRRVKDVI